MARLESCPTCGNKTSENASQCPACGEPLPPYWADDVRDRAKVAMQKAERIEVQAALARKRAKRIKWTIWVGIPAVLIFLLIGWGAYEDYYLRNLKENNPAEYLEKIQELEAKVAKVPASDFDENARLYKILQMVNPDSARYAGKLAHYQRKQKEAEAAAEARAKVRKAAEAKRDGSAKRNTENESWTRCKYTVAQMSKFPTKADFEWGKYDASWIGDAVTITGRVELMTGFGQMIPHKYLCTFKNGKLTDLDVTPG